MYTYDDLKKYEYFEGVNMNYALDSLTGVLSRTNILGFANHLITKNIPFMMGILDIDNFKLVNDNYGHKVGDECLKEIAAGLSSYLGDDGLIGRFGGDEFVIIYFKDIEYLPIHHYIEKMFNEGNIVRRRMKIDDISFLVTGTIGCASFPKDAKSYEELFMKVDKALYRGKTKGRNCFIIYVEAKHKNIQVHRKEESSLANIITRINEIANDPKLPAEAKIKNILGHVAYSLQISEAIFLKTDKKAITAGEGYNCRIDDEYLEAFDNLTKDNSIYMPNTIFNGEDDDKIVNFVKNQKILTFIISRVTVNNVLKGYIILLEGKVTRIWQEKDACLLLHLNTIFDLLYEREKKESN